MDAHDRLREAKEAIRNPITYGGYRNRIFMSDGEYLCHKCARDNWRAIVRATVNGDRSGWGVMGTGPSWEGPPDTCAHCGAEHESEYGETE